MSCLTDTPDEVFALGMLQSAGRILFDKIGPLTTGEWDHGLRQVCELVVERAPVLNEHLSIGPPPNERRVQAGRAAW